MDNRIILSFLSLSTHNTLSDTLALRQLSRYRQRNNEFASSSPEFVGVVRRRCSQRNRRRCCLHCITHCSFLRWKLTNSLFLCLRRCAKSRTRTHPSLLRTCQIGRTEDEHREERIKQTEIQDGKNFRRRRCTRENRPTHSPLATIVHDEVLMVRSWHVSWIRFRRQDEWAAAERGRPPWWTSWSWPPHPWPPHTPGTSFSVCNLSDDPGGDNHRTQLSGIHPGYSCKEGRRVEDGLLLEFPCTPTMTRTM
jgi:hypothetical protein